LWVHEECGFTRRDCKVINLGRNKQQAVRFADGMFL
jgi:hypothetical protein